MDEKQKTALGKLVGDEVVEMIESTGETETKRLEEEKIEFKEKKEVEEAVVEEEPKSEEPGEKEAEPTYLTLDDVKEPFEEFATVLKSIVADVDEMKASLKTLTDTDEAKIEKKIELTPKESLKSIVGSVIGKKETEIDGRTKLAKDGPEETTPLPEGSTGISFIDNIKARNAEKHRPGAFAVE